MDAVLSLLLTRGSDGEYEVNVVGSSSGGAKTRFRSPVDAVLGALDGPLEIAGQLLFEALLSGEVYNTFIESRTAARKQRQRLQLQLQMTSAPELAQLPWEAMYDPRERTFLAKSGDVSIVRFLALPRPVIPLGLLPPLRILVMAATPQDQIDVSAGDEALKLRRNLANLTEAGVLAIDQVRGGSATDLQNALAGGEYHALHFIGHGGTNDQGDGVLYFERPADRGSDLVTAETLSGWLGLHPSLRLVVLNTCEGARSSSVDPFSGTAQKLVQSGLPAVVGMQYPISDVAALEFANGFYHRLEKYAAIDDAVDSGRAAIRNDLEWVTPVTYLRSRTPFVTPPPWMTRQLMRVGVGRAIVNMSGLAKPGARWPVVTWAAVFAALAAGAASLLSVDTYRYWFNLTVVPGVGRALKDDDVPIAIALFTGLLVALSFVPLIRRIGITKVGYPATNRGAIYALAAIAGVVGFALIPTTAALTKCQGALSQDTASLIWPLPTPYSDEARPELAHRRVTWYVGSGNRIRGYTLRVAIEPKTSVLLASAAALVPTACPHHRHWCSVTIPFPGHFKSALRFAIATEAPEDQLSEIPPTVTTLTVLDAEKNTVFEESYDSPSLFLSAGDAVQCMADD